MTDTTVGVPEATLAWAAGVVGANARVVDVEQLRTWTGPWLLRIESGRSITEAVLKSGPAVDWRESYACEVAALELADEHDLPVPVILGSQLDAVGEEPVALLISRLTGMVQIPLRASMERLRALGRIAAEVHRIPLEPSPELPLRVRHTGWVDFSSMRRAARRYRTKSPSERRSVIEGLLAAEFVGWREDDLRASLERTESSPLFDEADEMLLELPVPDGPTVFVHGDLWQGNTLWSGDVCVGLIDWETAGAGQPGVDVGCLRWDAAILFGDSAADEVLVGWEDAADASARDVAYWDLVAALNTPADMRRIVPSLHEVGRSDLDAKTLNRRQDAFLRDALARLDPNR